MLIDNTNMRCLATPLFTGWMVLVGLAQGVECPFPQLLPFEMETPDLKVSTRALSAQFKQIDYPAGALESFFDSELPSRTSYLTWMVTVKNLISKRMISPDNLEFLRERSQNVDLRLHSVQQLKKLLKRKSRRRDYAIIENVFAQQWGIVGWRLKGKNIALSKEETGLLANIVKLPVKDQIDYLSSQNPSPQSFTNLAVAIIEGYSGKGWVRRSLIRGIVGSLKNTIAIVNVTEWGNRLIRDLHRNSTNIELTPLQAYSIQQALYHRTGRVHFGTYSLPWGKSKHYLWESQALEKNESNPLFLFRTQVPSLDHADKD